MKKNIFLLFIATLMFANSPIKGHQDQNRNVFAHQSLTQDQQDILDIIQFKNVKYVKFTFTDILGKQKEVIIPSYLVPDAFENYLLFDGSSVKGCSSISDSDMMLIPDTQTFTILPEINSNTKTAQIICNIYKNEYEVFEGCARSILVKAVNKARAMGYQALVGPELEFFLLITDPKTNALVPLDSNKYFDSTQEAKVHEFKCELINYLQAQNIPILKIHHEVANGQYEMSIHHSDALKMADTLIRAIEAIKTFAQNVGLKASFMPKPFSEKNGSGMHIHCSLAHIADGSNAFYDATDPLNLSPVAKHFIAGILNRAREMSVIFAPSFNSYKRLVPGYEAPTRICYGEKNRSACIRIPQIKAGARGAARFELRCPDALANPYLLFAAMIEAGLAGIENSEIIPQPINENLYSLTVQELKIRGIQSLPGSLREAIDLFTDGQLATFLFTPRMLTEYLKLKNAECNESSRAVTDWEWNRYL